VIPTVINAGFHGAPVLPQVPGRGIVGRIEQDWRHEERQRELRIERDGGNVGKQRERSDRERQQRGVGWVQPASEGREDRPGEEQGDD
jgi:hypothetical protein